MRSALARISVSVGILGSLLLCTPGQAQAREVDPVDSATTVQEIAEQLRQDPVFIQQTAGGGDVEAARKLTRRVITELDLDHPVYVVVGRLPVERDSSGTRTLAVQLRRLLGEDAVYAIGPLRSVPAVVPIGQGMPDRARNYDDTARVLRKMLRLYPDDFSPPSGSNPEISRVRDTTLAALLVQMYGLGGRTMTDEQVETIARAPFLHVVTADPDEEQALSSTGARWMVGTLAFLLVLGWLPWLIRKLARHEPKARCPSPQEDPADQTDWQVDDSELDRQRARLSQAIATLPVGRLRRPELYDVALSAKEAADLWAGQDSEPARLAALTLVEHGLHAAANANSSRPYVPWRPCFLNPLDGRATDVRQWVFGDAEIRVPLCAGCARRLDASRPARPLLVRQGRRAVPYYEVADVWGRTGYGSLVDDYPQVVLRDGAGGSR